MQSAGSTILIVLGLREHVADDWQTLLAAKLPKVVSVAPLEHDKRRCAARVDAIDRALVFIEGSVIAVAHSAGVIMLAHWTAQCAPREIKGALLAAPADLETPMPAGYPTTEVLGEHGWSPISPTRLPFPSIVAAGSNDPLARLERTRGSAQAWGSRFAGLGEIGHLNPASGHGEWLQAEEFIRDFL